MPSTNFLLSYPIFNSNGVPVPGAEVFFYYSGTNTKAPSFSNAGFTVPLPHPVKANAAARLPNIWLPDMDYRVVIRHPSTDDGSLGALIEEIDPFRPGTYPRGEQGPPGASGGEGGYVFLDQYPGTTPEADPTRFEHSNTQFQNAMNDTLNPESPNFGKEIAIRAFMGEGVRHADEWDDDGNPIAVDPYSGEPIDRKFLAEDGDTLIDDWSQNGRYEVADFPTPHDAGFLPGNLRSGVRIRFMPGARVRRAPRYTGVSFPADIVRPYIFVCDPNRIVTDPDAVDTQSDVYKNISIICDGDSGFISENHRWGYREHHNDISLNGCSDFYINTKHYGNMSDAVYIGAGNVGGGLWNRHNKRGEVHIVADGRNQLNRNVLSVIDCVGLRGTVRGYNFTRPGGLGNDPFNPNSGVLNPGVVDIEPNAFTDDPHVDDIELDVYAEDCGSSAVATLLIDNNIIPTPLGSMRFTGRAVRCKHGKHSLIGAVAMSTPYKIHLRMDALDCETPFEILAGQGCTHEGGLNLRSFRAGQIGYTGFGAPQDFNRLFEIDQELGSGDSCGIAVRGWNGGRISGGQMINAKNYGYQFLSNNASPGGSPIRDLIIESLEFVNRPLITSQSMLNAFYVNPSDGGPQIFPSTIIERDVRYNGLTNLFWGVSGSYVTSLPSGVWDAGQEVFGHPSLEPGGFRVARTYASNTTGLPFWYQQELIQPVPEPTTLGSTGFSSFVTNNMRVEQLGNGAIRLTAIGPNARWMYPSAIANFTLNLHEPHSGTTTVYAGGFNTATPTNAPSVTNTQLRWGLWAHDTTGGVLGRLYGISNGTPNGVLTGGKYGDRLQIVYASNNTSSVYKLNAANAVSNTVTQSGQPVQNLYPGVLILTPGESVVVRGITI